MALDPHFNRFISYLTLFTIFMLILIRNTNELLVDEMPDLSDLDPDHFLFTPEGIGGVWEATEENRRDHFSKRFKQVVKDHVDPFPFEWRSVLVL